MPGESQIDRMGHGGLAWTVWREFRRHCPFGRIRIRAATRLEEDLDAGIGASTTIARELSDLFCVIARSDGTGLLNTLEDCVRWVDGLLDTRKLPPFSWWRSLLPASNEPAKRAVRIVATLTRRHLAVDPLVSELGTLGPAAGCATGYLVDLMGADDSELRRRAARAAGTIGKPAGGAERMIRERLADPRETTEVREALSWALPHVRNKSQEGASRALDAAVGARMAQRGGPPHLGPHQYDAIDAMARRLDSGSDEERRIVASMLRDHLFLIPWRSPNAVHWLDRSGDSVPAEWFDWPPDQRAAVGERLVRCMRDAERSVRAHAAEALARLVPDDDDARRALASALEGERDDWVRRRMQQGAQYLHVRGRGQIEGRFVTDDLLLLDLRGEFDHHAPGHELMDEIPMLLPRKVLLDLNGIEMYGAAFLGVIVALYQELDALGADLCFALRPGPLRSAMEINGMTEVLDVVPSREEAEARLTSRSAAPVRRRQEAPPAAPPPPAAPLAAPPQEPDSRPDADPEPPSRGRWEDGVDAGMGEPDDPALVRRVHAMIPALEVGAIDWSAVEALRTVLTKHPERFLPRSDPEVQQIAYLLHRAGETEAGIGVLHRVLRWHLDTDSEDANPAFAMTNLKWLYEQAGQHLSDDEIRQRVEAEEG